ncbi:tRNA methyl transferase-domain-containing protein [Mycena leptocephala]|nr:tRNA methyl transferase-domain-containing protein [Mycena leptocephala]
MRNWDISDEYGNSDKACEWEKDWDDVQKVCKVYDIPCKMWKDGITPNPDVWCNREIKFGALLEHLPYQDTEKPPWLATVDGVKDQSYYLSSITQNGLSTRALFPIGDLTKPDVWRLAQDGEMLTSVLEREGSMGLCFEKKRPNFKGFISSYISPSPGPVKMLSTGKTVSEHNGLWSLTIGGSGCGECPKRLASLMNNLEIPRYTAVVSEQAISPGSGQTLPRSDFLAAYSCLCRFNIECRLYSAPY